MRRSLQVIAVAAACVLLASTAAYAAGPGAAGSTAQGEPLRNEARSGQDALPPAEDADLVRERDRVQDRLQDGSCEVCADSATQTRTRSKQGAGSGSATGQAADAEARPCAGTAAGRDEEAQRRAQFRNSVRNLVRLEARLQRVDGEGDQASQPALIAFALRLAERLQAWFAAL